MKTIVILFVNYGPYHVARVSALANYCIKSAGNIKTIGLELARNESEYAWQADISKLPFPLHSIVTNQLLQSVPSRRIISGLKDALNRLNPAAVAISGYSHPAMISALKWCGKNKRRSILMSESTEHDHVRNPVKEWIKSRIVRQFDSALAGGRPQKRYLVQLGMNPDKVFTGYDVVDNSIFSRESIQSLPNPMPHPYFLSISRFVPKKNLPALISAYAVYRENTVHPWNLVLCGDGELRPELEQLVNVKGLQNAVFMPGFIQQKEILPYLAHASCLVHASTHEQWGLVVNEAMAAGLPVLLSNRCGCSEDLLKEGTNGFSFNPYDIPELAALMTKMSSGSTDRQAMGRSSQQIISRFSPETFATGILAAAAL